MLYHHSYYGVSPLPLPNVISFTTTISTTSASLYHSCILDHCFFGLPLFVWTTTTLWIATIFLDYRCIYVSNKAVCDPNFRFFHSAITPIALYHSQYAILVSNYDGERSSYRWVTFIVGKKKSVKKWLKLVKNVHNCFKDLKVTISENKMLSDA